MRQAADGIQWRSAIIRREREATWRKGDSDTPGYPETRFQDPDSHQWNKGNSALPLLIEDERTSTGGDKTVQETQSVDPIEPLAIHVDHVVNFVAL